jgi:hypothetical protein
MLTMLGIIIGVAAVITMIAVGSGATERVQAQMKGLGSNIMLVLPGGITAGGVRLGAQTGQMPDRGRCRRDRARGARGAGGRAQLAHRRAGGGGQHQLEHVSIFGTTMDYLEARDWPIWPPDAALRRRMMAGSAKVAIIGQTVAAAAVWRGRPAGPDDPREEDPRDGDRRAGEKRPELHGPGPGRHRRGAHQHLPQPHPGRLGGQAQAHRLHQRQGARGPGA